MNDLHITQLLSSRLCHDLITPISAIANGLELLEECAIQDQGQIIDLIRKSADVASKRLSYFRAAFGNNKLSHLEPSVFTKILRDFLENHKILLAPFSCPDAPPLHWERIIFLSFFIMAETASHQASAYIHTDMENNPEILTCRIEGTLFCLKKDVHDFLVNDSEIMTLSPQTIPCYLLKTLLKDAHLQLSSVRSTPKEVIISIKRVL